MYQYDTYYDEQSKKPKSERAKDYFLENFNGKKKTKDLYFV